MGMLIYTNADQNHNTRYSLVATHLHIMEEDDWNTFS